MEKEVFYPPVGIVHITNDICDLVKYKYKNQNKIIINTSAQPNSSPHLGTITTIMCCFALAKKLKDSFNIEVEVQFDELENSPAEIIELEGNVYYKDLKNTTNQSGESLENINMKNFQEILNKISKFSNINYSTRTYNDFQKNIFVREAIIKIFNDEDYFSKLLFPSTNILYVRTLCPICNLGKKKINIFKKICKKDSIIIQENCPFHGDYEKIISKYNTEYVDINTQFRDLTKGIAMIEEDKKNNTLTIMLDGGDWSGIWAQRIHTEGMVRLGYKDFPIRLFAPVILDWSGAKFSKSLYLKKDSYANVNQAFINYNNFIHIYGNEGLLKLWEEIKSWIEEPKKFFRNYTVEYFNKVMENK